MYKCNCCGCKFTEPKEYSEDRTPGGAFEFGSFIEHYIGCPECSGGDYSEIELSLNDNMKYRKNRPLTYKIYEYLKKNAVGYKNRVKSSELMREFGINTNETLRTYIQEIRESETLQKVVCSEASVTGGYWIATNDEEVYHTLQQLYNRSMKMLETYANIKRKSRLNNQMRLKLNDYEKEIFESIMEEQND